MHVRKTLGVSLVSAALSFSFPMIGNADMEGIISVYAVNSNNSTTAPPSTTTTLDGSSSRNFGSSNLVTYSGTFSEGIHTVEVATASSGYALRRSPTDPNAVNDPDSDYGNPRRMTLSTNQSTAWVGFTFDPVITAAATVRDGWTMERLEDTAIEFIWFSSTNAYSKTKYPSNAGYATNWVTDASGAFPPDTIMYLHDYDLRLTLNGYEELYAGDVITNASPGDHFDLGTLFLYPDDLNTNNIGDVWETMHFGSPCLGQADADGDGMCNMDEYLAGTDPTNWNSCLWIFQTVETNGSILYEWDTVPDRTYRISGTTNLCADTWVQVAGAWEAADGQFSMSWAETNHHLSWCSSYRVNIMPSGWTGTNSILIRTNDWPTSSSGSSTNTYPNGPPTP